jgi:hypothetical protein
MGNDSSDMDGPILEILIAIGILLTVVTAAGRFP